MQLLGITLAAMMLIQNAPPHSPEPPAAEVIGDGVWMLKGDLGRGRQPDGNSVVFQTRAGLVVVDTGRHDWHRVGIDRLIADQGGRLAAIINTHWHLDHIIGNGPLKRDHPAATVYATGALDGAIPGFLARSRAGAEQALAGGQLNPAQAEDIRINLAAMDGIEALEPDVVVTADRALDIGGRTLELRVTDHAATEADLWVYDPASGVLAAGDLITLPVPYLDTACPEGWKAALDQVAAVSFRVVVPGHGPLMTRETFDAWHTAFDALADCAASERAAAECGADWARNAAGFYSSDRAREGAGAYAAGYVEQVLRAPDHRARFCPAERQDAGAGSGVVSGSMSSAASASSST